MARTLAKLIRDLAWLRRYRARRAQRVPWWIRIPYLRDVLRHDALDHWPGGYVTRTDGRIVYVPEHVDVTAGHRLFKPATHIELIEPLCRPGDCVLDIGANVGDWTIAMAARVGPLGKVIAFEPVPYLAQTIVKTARVNRHGWVEVQQLALGATDGTTEFSVERANSGGSRIGRVEGDFSQITVETKRLDSFFATRPDLNRVDFIKIDVEGFEEAVLQGARASLARFRPGLLFESGLESAEQRKSIHDLLSIIDYEPIGAAVPGGLIEFSWADYRDSGKVLADLGLCNLLFMPR
jgi:FkbM family methyltransferase